MDDGKGLRPVDDAGVAQNLLRAVNRLNVVTILQTLPPAILFSAIPQSITQPAAFLVALYYTVLFTIQLQEQEQQKQKEEEEDGKNQLS